MIEITPAPKLKRRELEKQYGEVANTEKSKFGIDAENLWNDIDAEHYRAVFYFNITLDLSCKYVDGSY